MPSMVVGICVGKELGWPPLTVTTPNVLLRSGASEALSAVCARLVCASHGNARPPSMSGHRLLFMNAYLGANGAPVNL